MSRRRELCVPPIELDRTSKVPLHRQIYQQIARAIRCDAIDGRARLPATRMMAKLLGVSRNTVLVAYDELAAADLIRGERGAGMWVNGGAAVDVTRLNLRQTIRAAGYPARILTLADPDGNALYLRV